MLILFIPHPQTKDDINDEDADDDSRCWKMKPVEPVGTAPTLTRAVLC